MEIEYDTGKDAINRLKRGISLAEAAHIDFGKAVVMRDTRHEYGEARFLAAAPIEGRLHMLAFTMRGDVLRAISLRRANRREVERYGKATSAGH